MQLIINNIIIPGVFNMNKLVKLMLGEDSGAVDTSIAINIPSPTDNKRDQKQLELQKQKTQDTAKQFVNNTVGNIPNEDIAKLTARDPGEPSAEIERNIKVWTQSRIIEYIQSDSFLNAYVNRFGAHTGYDYQAFTDDIIKNLERAFKFKLQRD